MFPVTSAAVYVRISSDPSGQRAGVERQHKECTELADRLGLTIVDTYEDNDTSAYSGIRRPGFEQLLDDAQAGRFGVVVVWASDRLYRRMVDLVRITADLAPHVRIVTVMGGEVDLTTAEGILRAQVMGSVAEFESRRKAERIRAAAKQRAEAGRTPAAHTPFGWMRTPEGLVPDPDTAPALAQAYRDIADGRSLAETYRRLAESVDTGRMRPSTLGGILRNPRNGGLAAYRGAVTREAADGYRVVSRALYEAVAAILNDPGRRTSPGRPVSTRLGGGPLRCGRCGARMAASSRVSRGGVRSAVYVCGTGQCMSRRRDTVDSAVLPVIGHVLSRLGALGLLRQAPAEDARAHALRAEIAAAEARLADLAALAADPSGPLDPRDFAAAARGLRTRLDTLTAQLSSRAARPAMAALADAQDVQAAWGALPDAEVRRVVREVVQRVVCLPDRRIRVEWAEGLPGLGVSVLDAPEPRLSGREERRAEVARLHAEGLNVSEIARRVGVVRATVRKDLRALA